MFIFDFAGTLANISPSKENILRRFLQRNKINIIKKDIQEAYYKTDNLLFYSSVKIKNARQKKNFYKKYNAKLFNILKIKKKNLYKKFYNFFYKTQKHWRLEKNIKHLLKNISQNNELALMSNFDESLEVILKKKKIYKYFDYLHISQKVNKEKPSLFFYYNFFKKYKIPIKNAIYFGDNYKLDYIPSKKIKLKFFLVDKNNLCKKKIKNKIKYVSEYFYEDNL